MIHYPNEIVTTEKLREILQDGQRDFPYVAIESNLESYVDRCSTWHWHDYFEFATVSRGEVEVCTQRQALRLKTGEGYFANSEVMHLCRVADGSDRAQLRVHQFDRSLVASCAAVSRRYVQPVESCTALDILVLRPEQAVDAGIIAELNAAFSEAGDEAEGFELSIATRIMRSWQLLYRLVEGSLGEAETVSSGDTSRIKLMLACIHTRYHESLTVPMIARAANVSPRECFRCFKQVLGTSPTLYLMRHRVNAAARLLIDTGRTITDIAMACGFSGPSYFCKVFHDVMGISPREFRRQRHT